MNLGAHRASSLLYNFVKTYNRGVYILPANVCPVVPLTFVKAGVSFEFIDIHPLSLCIDEKTLIKTVEKSLGKYAGVVFVRTYGYQNNTDLLFRILKERKPDFKIIDDKCLCFPDSNPIQPNVDMELFSTGYAKSLDLKGGGYAKLGNSISFNKNHSQYDSNAYSMLESNYKSSLASGSRIKDINQNWLNTEFWSIDLDEYFIEIEEQISVIKKHKKRLNDIYKSDIPKEIQFQSEFQSWRFNILVNNKTAILNELMKHGLFASSHYVPSNTLFDNDKHPNAEKLSCNIINLFNDLYYTEEKAIDTCKIIRRNL
ncbi:MAG: hypothetical protein RBR35_04625 [Salinivirgaceae bacterium]|nr:hypothetical protein [Salinivirgaceae bacterium]